MTLEAIPLEDNIRYSGRLVVDGVAVGTGKDLIIQQLLRDTLLRRIAFIGLPCVDVS